VDNYKHEKFPCWQNQKSDKTTPLIHQAGILEVAANRRTTDYMFEVEVKAFAAMYD
jgi:hypothetical protein